MKAEEFFNNGKYEPNDIVDWGEEGVFYSIEDVQAYSDHENKELYDDLVQKRVECVKLEEENKELSELLIDAWCKDNVHPLSHHNEKKCDWCIERDELLKQTK